MNFLTTLTGSGRRSSIFFANSIGSDLSTSMYATAVGQSICSSGQSCLTISYGDIYRYSTNCINKIFPGGYEEYYCGGSGINRFSADAVNNVHRFFGLAPTHSLSGVLYEEPSTGNIKIYSNPTNRFEFDPTSTGCYKGVTDGVFARSFACFDNVWCISCDL